MDLDHVFTYHKPTAEQIPKYEELRAAAKEFAATIQRLTPPCADQTAAMRKVREAEYGDRIGRQLMKCRFCGCSDNNACRVPVMSDEKEPGGATIWAGDPEQADGYMPCYWVVPGICSAPSCVMKAYDEARRGALIVPEFSGEMELIGDRKAFAKYLGI